MSHFEPNRYVKLVDDLRSTYQSFPSTISIETLSLCNAYCSFCPYHTIKRKGAKLPDNVIDRIIDEFSSFPDDRMYTVVLSRVNEPFLDKRWFNIAQRINRISDSFYFGFFSNGSTLHEDTLSKLSSLPNITYLNISLNYSRKADYESITRLNYLKTISNIDMLHKRKEKDIFDHEVLISRVGTGDEKDLEFKKFVTERYPLFRLKIEDRIRWLTDLTETESNEVGHVPCRQWFQSHILADGNEGYCCIDPDGRFGSGSIFKHSILDLYNNAEKRTSRAAKHRTEVDICRNCTFMP